MTSEMDEFLNTIAMIGAYKSMLPVEVRGWVNALGLYVQLRESWSSGRVRCKAGGKYRCYLDYRDGPEEGVRIVRFDITTWNRRFAHLVRPTYQIGEFLVGPVDCEREPMEAKIGVVRKAIAEFERTGVWADLPKTAKEARVDVCGEVGVPREQLRSRRARMDKEEETTSDMICSAHPWNAAVGTCTSCGSPICSECLSEIEGRTYCAACAMREWGKMDFGPGTQGEFAQMSMLSSLLVWGRVTTGTPSSSSGLDKEAVLPSGMQGWNWGAFFWTWIWGIGNGTRIALLGLVPIGNFVMPFVLGKKGSEWAWRNKRWKSVEDFRKVQNRWAAWGWVFFAVALWLGVGQQMFGSLLAALVPMLE